MRKLRLILGFVGATSLPALAITVPFLLGGQWQSFFSLLGFGLSITAPPAIVVALPLYWWLSRSGRLSVYTAVLTGAAAGGSFGLLGAIRRFWLFGKDKTVGEVLRDVIILEEPHIFVLIGAFCGLVGWVIAFGLRTTPPEPETPKAD
jgi:hypothetical protein